MNTNPKTKSRTEAPEQFLEMAEKGATQSKEAFEKMSATAGRAAEVMQNCYSAAVKGMQDYNSKLLEFANANTKAAFDFAQRMSGVKSPSEFIELSTEHAQQQLTTLTEQTRATRGACPADDARDCGAAEDITSADVHLRFIRPNLGESDLTGIRIAAGREPPLIATLGH